MSIKEKLELVRSQVGEEDLPKINTILEEIEMVYSDLSETHTLVSSKLKSANAESRERRLKIEGFETQIEELNKTNDTTELKAELESLREFKVGQLKLQREGFEKSFDEISKHPNFEKAKTRFALPEVKDEKYQWDKISNDDFEKNMSTLNDLNELDYFKVAGKEKPDTFGDRFNDTTEKQKTPIKTRAELDKYLQGAFKEQLQK